MLGHQRSAANVQFISRALMSLRSPQILGSVLFAVGLLTFLCVISGHESQKAKQAAVYEAVLRKLLEMPDVRHQGPKETVCIANDKHLLDRDLLRRLKGNSFQLAWLATSEYTAQHPSYSAAEAPLCAVVLYVSEIRWQGWREADVAAGYGCGAVWAYSGIFHVTRAAWGWRVESVGDTLISHLPGWKPSPPLVTLPSRFCVRVFV